MPVREFDDLALTSFTTPVVADLNGDSRLDLTLLGTDRRLLVLIGDGALGFTVPQLGADYKGTLSGDNINGTFTQVGMAFPLNLARGAEK